MATEIGRLREFDGIGYGDVAVFYRTNAQSRALEEELVRAAHPLQGGGRHPVLRPARGQGPPGLRPGPRQPLRRGLGPAHRERAPPRGGRRLGGPPGRSGPAHNDCSFVDALDHAAEAGVTGQGRRRGRPSCGALLDELRPHGRARRRARRHSSRPWPSAPATAPRSRPRTPSKPHGRMENIAELAGAAAEYDSLDEFLESVALVSDSDELDAADSRVSLMTLHTAKGLEFPAVFLVGLEDGVFPHIARPRGPPPARGGTSPLLRRHHPGPTPALPDPRLEPDAVGIDQPRHPQSVPVRAPRPSWCATWARRGPSAPTRCAPVSWSRRRVGTDRGPRRRLGRGRRVGRGDTGPGRPTATTMGARLPRPRSVGRRRARLRRPARLHRRGDRPRARPPPGTATPGRKSRLPKMAEWRNGTTPRS